MKKILRRFACVIGADSTWRGIFGEGMGGVWGVEWGEGWGEGCMIYLVLDWVEEGIFAFLW